MPSANTEETQKYIDSVWEEWYVAGLSDFIRVPNLTPMVDPDYLTNGLVEKSAELVDQYIQKLDIKGLSKKTFAPEGVCPLIVYVVEGNESTQNVMLYGHLDKQPWMDGWDEGLGPCDPVIRGEYLYGRGGADDGYSPFSCMLAIKNAQLQGLKMPRCALVLETEEESGSPNLIRLLNDAKDFIGKPDFCFCMDSGAFNYEKLWLTSSLRGITIVDVTIQGGKTAFHSGETGGIVPETFRVLRTLLDRIDDSETGRVIAEFDTELPDYAQKEAEHMVELSGDTMWNKYAVAEGVQHMNKDDLVQMYLNNTWRANLSITGASGLPEVAKAGNVVRASTTVRMSMRLPPNMDPKKATAILTEKLTTDVPYNCSITIHGGHEGQGFSMNSPEPWVAEALSKSATSFFGKDYGSYGMGGSIPFLAELGKMYPETQIMALGLIGPKANAHAPNECINLTYAKKLTCALSHMVAAVGEHA